MSGAAGFRIFLNYRREDASGHAGRLYDFLRHRGGEEAGFTKEQIFMDIDTIAPGVDFRRVIAEAVSSCDVFIAVIGRQWLNAADAKGRRRLDNVDDFVRLEIQAALERHIPVVPALVQGAEMPSVEEVPKSLQDFLHRNAVELSDARWSYDVGRLTAWLQTVEEESVRRQEVERERLEQLAEERADEERAERERAELAAVQQAERERLEKEAAERAERERLERETAQRERAKHEAPTRPERDLAHQKPSAVDETSQQATQKGRWFRAGPWFRAHTYRVVSLVLLILLLVGGAILGIVLATQHDTTSGEATTPAEEQERLSNLTLKPADLAAFGRYTLDETDVFSGFTPSVDGVDVPIPAASRSFGRYLYHSRFDDDPWLLENPNVPWLVDTNAYVFDSRFDALDYLESVVSIHRGLKNGAIERDDLTTADIQISNPASFWGADVSRNGDSAVITSGKLDDFGDGYYNTTVLLTDGRYVTHTIFSTIEPISDEVGKRLFEILLSQFEGQRDT